MTELFALPDAFVPEAGVVVAMLVVEIFLLLRIVPRTGPSSTVAWMVLVTSALLGSAGVLLSLLWAFLHPNLNSFTILFETFGVTMGFPPGLWMIGIIAFQDRRIDARSWTWPAAVVGLATAGELLMGFLLTLVEAPTLTAQEWVSASLLSGWYLWSMGAAMVALLLWIPLPRAKRFPLLGLAGSAFAAPYVLTSPIEGAALAGAVMVATFALSYAALRPIARLRPEDLRLVLGVLLGFAVMTLAGLGVALLPAEPAALLAFGLVVSGVMVAEFFVLLREGFALSARSDPSTGVLGGTSVAPVATHPART